MSTEPTSIQCFRSKIFAIEMEKQNENLEDKHRKEKKELQAKTQALKKIAKGDKTRKKEISLEIARLELELENQQKEEIDAVSPDKSDEPVETVCHSINDCKNKVSKAQKRREKKALEEKEREKRIVLQEKLNKDGPRNTETNAINARLREKGLKVFSICSNGDCLYKAVSHQLELTGRGCFPVDELRKKTATFLSENKSDFLPFMSNPDTFDMLNDKEFEEYCRTVAVTKSWGGQIELRALSNSLKCPIYVVQASGPDEIKQGDEFDGPPLILSYHRHMYKLGEHYNSTQVLDESDRETL